MTTIFNSSVKAFISANFRKIRNLLLLIVLVLTLFTVNSSPTYAQSSEENAIKAVIKAETMGYYGRDAAAWQNTWVQDAKASKAFVTNGYYGAATGWENFGPEVVKSIKANPKPVPVELSNENYIIHSNENLAWVEYDQIFTAPSIDPDIKQVSKEKRALVKKDEQWKIISQISYAPEQFGNSPQAIESSLNAAGYKLMSTDKIKEAIDVFKLNVQLFPQSANTYDSLGEANALDGNKELAIKNYEKAIELNPKNEGAKTALAKLK
ncbi:hypothetical protein BH23BAC1_BH23BAC1_17440 [soil metagenome]